MNAGVPFPWALAPMVPPACSGKRAGGTKGELEPAEGAPAGQQVKTSFLSMEFRAI